jgi:transposase
MQSKKAAADHKRLDFCLSAHIPRHNLYYRLKQALKLEDLYEKTKKHYGRCGQKSIDPVVLCY